MRDVVVKRQTTPTTNEGNIHRRQRQGSTSTYLLLSTLLFKILKGLAQKAFFARLYGWYQTVELCLKKIVARGPEY